MKKRILSLLFPGRCPVCDAILPIGDMGICGCCVHKLKIITSPRCRKCGKKLYGQTGICADCKSKHHYFVQGRALYEYESAAASIYRFKYGKRQEYAAFFGEEAAFYLGDFIRSINPDGLIPIPLHRRRQNKRGYNQSKLLADALGKELKIPVYDKILFRIKDTKPLKKQNSSERQNNLKRAFIIRKNDVKLDTIILVDDIYTTGSTVDEAARILREHGVRKVYVITLACGAGV